MGTLCCMQAGGAEPALKAGETSRTFLFLVVCTTHAATHSTRSHQTLAISASITSIRPHLQFPATKHPLHRFPVGADENTRTVVGPFAPHPEVPGAATCADIWDKMEPLMKVG